MGKSKYLWRFLSILLLGIGLNFSVFAGIPPKPNPQRLYNNFSSEFPSFLSPIESHQLEAKLRAFSDSTSNQIVVVVVDDFDGNEAWSFATELGQAWGVGQNEFDNGVVVLIKPTGGPDQRKIHIAVGYGLEGAIPDLTAKRIIDREIVPYFKANRYADGIHAGVDVLMALAVGEYNSQQYQESNDNPMAAFIVMAIIFLIVFVLFRNKGNDEGGMGVSSRGFWYGMMLGNMMGGSRGGGGFGSGGIGGGGFGGFGGGGFGGGGAGGSW